MYLKIIKTYAKYLVFCYILPVLLLYPKNKTLKMQDKLTLL